MITRRNIIASGAAIGTVAGLGGCSPAAAPAAAVAAVAAAAPEVETVLQVVYGLVVAGAIALDKKFDKALAAIDAGARIADVAGKVAQNGANASAPGYETGQSAANPKKADAIAAPMGSLQNGVTATIQFPQLPILPGSDRPAIYMYVTPIVWDRRGVGYAGQPFPLPTAELGSPVGLYAPGFQQPDVPSAGAYRFGYRFWSDDNTPDLFGAGPMLHVFSDDDWHYDDILRSEEGIPRPETVYSQTYAFDPKNDAVLRALA